jgi:hypothetical protein
MINRAVLTAMGRQPINLTGRRFGRLVAKERVGTAKGGTPIWQCLCDCGDTTQVRSANLLQNNTESCGCLQADLRNDFLYGRQTRVKVQPNAIEITYPIPTNLHPVLQRRYQMRWERVEREIKFNYPEPQPKTKRIARDNMNRIIEPIDLIALGKRKREDTLRVSIAIPFVPSSVVVGASVADRVRVMSAEEWARL